MSRRSPSSSGDSKASDELHAEGDREAVAQVVFGKRTRPPEREMPLSRERLWSVGAELNLLFAYRVAAAEPFAAISEMGGGQLWLLVARSVSLLSSRSRRRWGFWSFSNMVRVTSCS